MRIRSKHATVPSHTHIFAHTRMGLSHMCILIWAAHTRASIYTIPLASINFATCNLVMLESSARSTLIKRIQIQV